MSRSLAAAFVTEKNRLWAEPFNSAVFHFGGTVGDIFVSDRDVTISANVHKGVVKEWGEHEESVDPADGNFQIASRTITLNNFPIFGSPAKRFTDLWSGIGVEGVEVDFYQNFRQIGTTTILQELAFKYVCNPVDYTPITVTLELISVSEKYLGLKEVSEPIDRSDFPLASMDAIGKRAPVIYGSAKKVQAQAVKAVPGSILREAMTSSQTTASVYDEIWDILPSSGSGQIGAEKFSYTGKGGVAGSRTLTGLTRGADGTTAEAHNAGEAVFFFPGDFIYLVAGHKVKAISKVYVRQGDKFIPVDASRYTVELGNTTLVSGRTLAIIKFTVPALQTERLYEQKGTFNATGSYINFGGQDKTKNSGKFEYALMWEADPTTIGAGEQVYILRATSPGSEHPNLILIEGDAAGKVVNNVGSPYEFVDNHFHELESGTNRFDIGHLGVTINVEGATVKYRAASAIDDPLASLQPEQRVVHLQKASGTTVDVSSGTGVTYAVPFGTQEKTKIGGKFRYRFRWSGFVYDKANSKFYIKRHTNSSTETPLVFYQANSAGQEIVNLSTVEWEDDHWHDASTTRRFEVVFSKVIGSFTIVQRFSIFPVEVQYDIQNPGAAVHVDHLLPTSTADLVNGGKVFVDVDGYQDDGIGTYTGVANALIEKPADILHHLARVVGGVPAGYVNSAAFVTARNNSPTSYKLSGVLTDRSANLKTLMLVLAQQTRLHVDWPADKLTCYLEFYGGFGPPASLKQMTEDNVMEDGGDTSLRASRTPLEEIINVINLRHGRDWSMARDEGAFLSVRPEARDASSVTKYGERKDDEQFWYDFIDKDNSSMADEIRDFKLARFKEPARRLKFNCKLDQFELLPGDIFTMRFYSKQPGTSGGITMPAGGIVVPVGGIVVETATAGEFFDNLDGTQKFLVEAVRHHPGNGREESPTRMAMTMREVS